MTLQLFHNAASPFVRKVMVLLHETGQLADVQLVPAVGHPLDDSRMPVAQNPLGKLPTLARPDGPAIYDSRVICQYLDERAGAGLYGAGQSRWDIMTVEATADGMMDAAVLMVYESRTRPEALRHAPWVEAQWTKFTRAAEVLNQRWMGLLKGPLTMAQIAVGCALGYADFRHADRDWRTDNPELADWFAELSARESFARTAPQG